jgi:hypothetical protein
MDQRASSEASKGNESNAHTQERLEGRLKELLGRELELLPAPALGASPAASHAPPVTGALQPPPPGTSSEGLRAGATQTASKGPSSVQSALELVQQIELFMKSQRPALAMTLTSGGGKLEVERTGPGAVSLRLRGVGLSAAQTDQLQALLSQRGLSLSELKCA